MTSVAPLTIGLDLGDTTSEVCVLDATRKTIERGPVETTPESLKALFERYPGSNLVFEVGSQSRWVQQLANSSDLGIVTAADPRQLQLITKSFKKTDRKDAYVLCRAGQGLPELLHPVEHRSEDSHAKLQVVRSRDLLVEQRTRLVNRIRGMVKSTGNKMPSCDAAYFFRKAPQHIPVCLQPATTPLFAILESIHEQLRLLKKELQKIADSIPAVSRLQQVPSIGLITALTFVLTVEDPTRFRINRNVGAYFGLSPRKKDSGDSEPQLPITKAGDTHLRRLFVVCAHHLLHRGKDCALKQWGLELCRRGGKNAKKRAAVAVARKFAVHLLAIWKSGEDYDLWRDTTPELANTPVA
jgi:transposase